MRWTLCVSDGKNQFTTYAETKGSYPRSDDNGWYSARMTDGNLVLVNKRFVVFMYPDKEGSE